MQNKGAIKLFAIAFALVSLYQLSFTYFTKRVENKANADAYGELTKSQAKQLANGDEVKCQFYLDSLGRAKESYFLDSMSNETVYNFLWMRKFSYKDCKVREINLGLDLKGGMNVMMEVSTVDVVRALANHTTDTLFNKAIDMALEKQKNTNSDFVHLFYQSIVKLDPNVRLAGYFSSQLREKIKLGDNNDQVIEIVSKECGDAYDRTYQILRQRIDKFGVAQPNIQKLDASERILIELPGIKEPERVRKLLQGTAQLEFWLTAEFLDVYEYLRSANDFLASVSDEEAKPVQKTIDTDSTAKTDEIVNKIEKKDTNSALATITKSKDTNSLKGKKDQSYEEFAKENPLFSKLQLNLYEGRIGEGPVVGYALLRDKDAIDKMLAKAREKKIIPSNVKFLWDAKPFKGNNGKQTDFYQLYAISVTTRDGSPLLGGEVITDASQDVSNTGGIEISMSMNSEGAKDWKKITGANAGKCIAIVLDNLVYSAPRVNGEIAGGRSSITGNFSIEEAKDLANILKAGKLPAPAKIVQEAVVGPSLGKEAINAGLLSFIIAFVMVLIYMVAFYSRSGVVACIALLTNVFFLLGILASLGAVLTLPGIAGIVLTMAMAVDANVIISERVKEELRTGKSIASSITDGYKNAYSAIIDGNVTTLLTGIVLMVFGTGPIAGFAVTLSVGILTSLFTSIFISRIILERMLRKKQKVTFSFKFSENFLSNTKIDFVAMRKKFYYIIGAVVLVSLISITFKGMNYGIDFKGGRTYVIRFDQDVKTSDVRKSLAAEFEGNAPEVKTFGPNNQIKVTTKYKLDEESDEVKNEVNEKLYNGTKKFFADDLSLKEFESTAENPLGIISSEIVGPTIANDIKRSAVLAVVISLVLIFIYIGIRFNKWQFGFGGLVALAHDALVTIGAFSLFSGFLPFSMEVDQSFIAAILTVIGYSINDTVIVFDRVRENMALYPKRTFRQQMNEAINSTLSRTVNTTGTTLIVLLMIFIFGGEVIRGFAFALLFGISVGVFSSIFIACPVAYDLISRKERKALAKKQ